MTSNGREPAVIAIDGPDPTTGEHPVAAATTALGVAAAALGLAVVTGADADAALTWLEELGRSGRDVAAVVIGPHVVAAVGVARRLHQTAPLVHLVFAVDDAGATRLRRELALAPRIGTNWTIARAEPEPLLAALRDAIRVTRQRQHQQATLARVRDRLGARPARAGETTPSPADELAARLAIERRRNARLEVTQALVDEPDLARSAPRILRALGAGFGWDCGVLWLADPAAKVLRAAAVWQAEGAGLDAFVGATQEITFGLGAGVPGQVWRDREPRVVDDVRAESAYARAAVAVRDDLRTAYFHPIILAGEVLGVVELIGRERRELDADFHELIGAAAGSIGQLAERARIDAALRRHHQELVETDRRKNEFLAMLAHELRNPLAPVDNAIRILRDDRATPDEVGQARGAIERQVTTVSRLVEDLLDVARIATGKLQLRTERIELAPLIARSIDTVRPSIDLHGLELSVTIPSEPLWLDADPVRIEQVLTNLLVNATKHTDRGGRIWLTAAPVGPMTGARRVVVAVRDTGIGLSEDVRATVFDMFAQAPGSPERDRGGLGIGLTLVKRLVELHGGEVAVSSAGAYKGSEFTVRLPLLDALGVTAPPAPPAPAAKPAPLGPLRILIVDDNTDAADTLELVLRRDGHDVCTAYDGPSALAIAAELAPDVVLLDIGLPGMDGYEVAARLRAGEAPPRLVAVTGWGMAADHEHSRSLGFDHHLVKPAKLDDIRRIIADVAAARARSRG